MRFWPVRPVVGLVLVIAALIGIAVSPLTRLSMYSGVIWLALLFGYYQVRNMAANPSPRVADVSEKKDSYNPRKIS